MKKGTINKQRNHNLFLFYYFPLHLSKVCRARGSEYHHGVTSFGCITLNNNTDNIQYHCTPSHVILSKYLRKQKLHNEALLYVRAEAVHQLWSFCCCRFNEASRKINRRPD